MICSPQPGELGRLQCNLQQLVQTMAQEKNNASLCSLAKQLVTSCTPAVAPLTVEALLCGSPARCAARVVLTDEYHALSHHLTLYKRREQTQVIS